MKLSLRWSRRMIGASGRLRRPLLVTLALAGASGTHYLATTLLPIQPPQVVIFNQVMSEFRKDFALVERGLLNWAPFDGDNDKGEQSVLAFDEQRLAGLGGRLMYGSLDAEKVFLRCDMFVKLGVIYAKMHPSEQDNKVNAMHWFERAAECNPGAPFSQSLTIGQANAFARQRLAISRNIDMLYAGGGKGNPDDMQQSEPPSPNDEKKQREQKKKQEEQDKDQKEQKEQKDKPAGEPKDKNGKGEQKEGKDQKTDKQQPNAGQDERKSNDPGEDKKQPPPKGEGAGKDEPGAKGNNPSQSNVPPPDSPPPQPKDDRSHEHSEGGGSPAGAPASVDGRKSDVNDAI